MASSRDSFVQAGPVCTGMPSFKYFSRRVASGYRNASDSTPRVPCCLESMKPVRLGACVSSSTVAYALDARVSMLGSTGGG